MNKRQIYQSIQDGTLEEKLKASNRTWWLTFVLFATIWIGYCCIQHSRVEAMATKGKYNDSLVVYQQTVIDMQKEALDSAVFFSDIKLRAN